MVDVDLAVVFDETQFSEFVHEEIDPWACRSDHLRQHFLRYFGKVLLRLARRAVAREQVESARRPRTVVGAIAVAVAMQTDWPARQPSSRNHRDNHVFTVFCKGDDSHPPIVLAFHPAGESFFKQPVDCDNMYLYQ
jgi:hypothetical protein